MNYFNRPRISNLIFATILGLSICSCVNKPESRDSRLKTRQNGTLLSFQSLSAGSMPGKLFVFPPLRSNSKGIPIENLTAVIDSDGNTTDWQATTARSNHLRKSLENGLSSYGYDIISFGELLDTTEPYSVLVISSFYSDPEVIEGKDTEDEIRACVVMLKGSVFGLDLDPSKKRDLVKIDGLSRYPSAAAPSDPVALSIRELLRKIGENETGYIYLK